MDIQKVMENLRKNNFKVSYVATKAEVVPLIDSLTEPGSSAAVGGSVTLSETGVLEHLRSGKYRFFDRYAAGLTEEERAEVFRQSAFADYFFCSSNAITEDGKLYNVDGNGNRIAALIYGPKQVIVVAGVNKIVPDLDAAVRRVKTVAAPKNAARLHCATYCANAGRCVKADAPAGEGCDSPARICCDYLVSAQQRVKDRIHVILVGEDCGY